MNSRIFIIIAALITYGSLYPFHFTVPEPHGAAWVKLFTDWSLVTSRMHALGHIALFLPVGFAGAFAVAVRAGLPLRIAAITLVSVVLALALQAAQIYVPERTTSLGDVIWDTAGAVVGMVAGMLAGGHSHVPWQRWLAEAALPLGLVAPWLAAELLPFVPSPGAQSLTTSLQTLLHPTLAPAQIVFHAAGALIAGRALAAALGDARSVRWLFALVGAVAAGKMLIATRMPDVSALFGFALGCAGWWLLARWREPRRGTALLLLLFGAYAVGALMPFEFRNAPEPFNLVPFAEFLRGSLLVNSTAMAANLCLYMGILGVIRLNHVSPVPGSIALAVLVALFEAIQTYLVGHTPDITEPLLVLLAGQILCVAPLPVLRTQTPARPAPLLDRATSGAAVGAPMPTADFNMVGWGLGLVITCLAIALAFSVVLRLTHISYHGVEFVLRDGVYPFLFIFALALLWVGAGARLVGHHVASSTHAWLTLPLLAIGAGIVSFLLMWTCMTLQGMSDVFGSYNLYSLVNDKRIWGEWGRQLVLLMPEEVTSLSERVLRYATLYGPLVTFPALMFAGIEMHEHDRIDVRRVAPLVISAVLWLWLCKTVAFDWSSTRNLNELIASEGPWGMGGSGYLYALLALISANAVLLARMPLTFTVSAIAAVMTLATVPVGWWLLNLGLDQQVHKYSQLFSGVQSLIGSDGNHLPSPEVLFLGWSVAQLTSVLTSAAGARFARPLIARRAHRRLRYTPA